MSFAAAVRGDGAKNGASASKSSSTEQSPARAETAALREQITAAEGLATFERVSSWRSLRSITKSQLSSDDESSSCCATQRKPSSAPISRDWSRCWPRPRKFEASSSPRRTSLMRSRPSCSRKLRGKLRSKKGYWWDAWQRRSVNWMNFATEVLPMTPGACNLVLNSLTVVVWLQPLWLVTIACRKEAANRVRCPRSNEYI